MATTAEVFNHTNNKIIIIILSQTKFAKEGIFRRRGLAMTITYNYLQYVLQSEQCSAVIIYSQLVPVSSFFPPSPKVAHINWAENAILSNYAKFTACSIKQSAPSRLQLEQVFAFSLPRFHFGRKLQYIQFSVHDIELGTPLYVSVTHNLPLLGITLLIIIRFYIIPFLLANSMQVCIIATLFSTVQQETLARG